MHPRRSPPRLLDVRTRELMSFPRDQAPPYAILSHTWTPDGEEVTYQEWKDVEASLAGSVAALTSGSRLARHTKGYAKIVNACRQADADGLAYLWADTCCINKQLAVEVDEAIQSMYAWYAEAERCYAYLSDFDTNKDITASVSGTTNGATTTNEEADFTARISRCAWFFRGWTLPELLAPKVIEFFDADWHLVKAPGPLWRIISNITRIPEKVLTKEIPITACCVAQRLSWAAGRQTSRAEDQAYSLFGVLGVRMTPLYGEGSEAFVRLQKELLQATRDPTIFAWTSSDPARKTSLLASTPEDFRHSTNIGFGRALGTYCQFSLSNIGIAGEFLVIEPRPHDRNQVLALLNCCLDDVPSMTLALRLTIHLEESQHGKVAYYVDELDHNKEQSPLFARLALISDEHLGLAQLRQMNIMSKCLRSPATMTEMHRRILGNIDASGLHVQYFSPQSREIWPSATPGAERISACEKK